MYPTSGGPGAMLAVIGLGFIVGQHFFGGAILTAFAVALLVLTIALLLAARLARKTK